MEIGGKSQYPPHAVRNMPEMFLDDAHTQRWIGMRSIQPYSTFAFHLMPRSTTHPAEGMTRPARCCEKERRKHIWANVRMWTRCAPLSKSK
jgi:hypothetical protein